MCDPIKSLQQLLEYDSDLELAFLVGSRARNEATPDSDWDIALLWRRSLVPMQKLMQTEKLRNQLVKKLNTINDEIDLIDIQSAGLAMHEVIANEGIILKGENTLALSHFLHRTWRSVEEYYWEQIYAA